MPFVKLDCGILDSTLWLDRDAREVFITALLLASPHELREPAQQVEVRSLKATGWSVPPGWYGFVPAAGVGIVRRAGIEHEAGLKALERLGAPEPDSRSRDHDGRRLVRVDGGFIVLNYDRYRQKDTSNAERQRRFRERLRAERNAVSVTPVTSRRNQEEAEAEAERNVTPPTPPTGVLLEELACPACQVSGSLIRERPAAGRTSPGWHCWPKQGGCGAYFEITEPRILERLTPRVRDSIRRLIDVPSSRSPGPVLPSPAEEAAAAEALAAWLPLVAALKERVGVHPWATWIRPLRAVRLADKELVLEAPNPNFRAWVLSNHVANIRAVAAEAGLEVGLVLPGEVHSEP